MCEAKEEVLAMDRGVGLDPFTASALGLLSEGDLRY